MKKLSILTSLLLLVSCNSSETTYNDEPNENMKSLTLEVSAASAQSRVAIDESSDDSAWNFVWVDGDQIEVWHDGCSALTTFSMATHAPELSTFSGSVESTVQDIRVIHTTDQADATLSGGELTLDIAAQNGALDKTYMMSDDVVSLGGDETIGSLSMKHVGGFFAIYLKVENAIAGSEYKVTKLSIDGMPTAATIDLAAAVSDELYDDDTLKGVITATVDETLTSISTAAELRFNALPFTYAVGDSLTFELEFEINGAAYTESFVKTNTSESDILFERSKYNYSTVTIDGKTGLIEVDEISGATIDPWEDGNDGSDDIFTQLQ